jgi:hypothetical protein
MTYAKQVGLMFGLFGVVILISASFQSDVETAIDCAVAGSGLIGAGLYYAFRR